MFILKPWLFSFIEVRDRTAEIVKVSFSAQVLFTGDFCLRSKTLPEHLLCAW